MSCNTKKCKWKNVVVNMEKQIVALLQVKRKCDVKKKIMVWHCKRFMT